MVKQDPKIAVKPETKLKLDGVAVCRETYDDIINKLLKSQTELLIIKKMESK